MCTLTVHLPKSLRKTLVALAEKEGYTPSRFPASAAGRGEDFERHRVSEPGAPPLSGNGAVIHFDPTSPDWRLQGKRSWSRGRLAGAGCVLSARPRWMGLDVKSTDAWRKLDTACWIKNSWKYRFSALFGWESSHGPTHAEFLGMKTIVFKVHGKSGDYVRPTLIPANHSEEAHFGLMDGVVVGFFVVVFGCLAFLFLS